MMPMPMSISHIPSSPMFPPPSYLLFLLFRLLLFVRAIEFYAFDYGFDDELCSGLFLSFSD
jgi:hypothetical protein